MKRDSANRLGAEFLKRKGYGTYVSPEAVDDWLRTPPLKRLEWIEEMIRLEKLLPRKVRDLHEKFRRAEI